MEDGGDDIPAVWGMDEPITWRRALSAASFIVWLILYMMPGVLLLTRVKSPVSVYDIAFWLYISLASVSMIVGALVGKYGWLFLMSFIVGKAEVGPMVACGIPRRISRFDRRFIEKHFRT